MCSGKTTVANHLLEKYKYNTVSLAAPIKVMESELADGIPSMTIVHKYMDHLDPMQKAMFKNILDEALLIPREHPKPRKRLQFIGTEGGRNRISQSLWIDLANRTAETMSNAIIDDVRFVNEFKYFRERGWKAIILTIAPDVQENRIRQLYGKFDPAALSHPSETGVTDIINLNDADLTIDTNNEISHTLQTIDEAIEQW